MTQIKLRRDTSANFTSKNPVLGIGEPAYETDTKKLKIGDGTTAYTQLEYFSTGGGGMEVKETSTANFNSAQLLETGLYYISGAFSPQNGPVPYAVAAMLITMKWYSDSTNQRIQQTWVGCEDLVANQIYTRYSKPNGVMNSWVRVDSNKIASSSVLGSIKVGNGLTISSDGTLSASGGSAPSNMMTTDTNQTITGAKTFTTELISLSTGITNDGLTYSTKVGSDTYICHPVVVREEGTRQIEIGDSYNYGLQLLGTTITDGSGDKFLTSGDKDTIMGYIMPDYSTRTEVPWNTDNTAPTDGYVEIMGQGDGATNSFKLIYIINGTETVVSSAYSSASDTKVLLPVICPKGTIYKGIEGAHGHSLHFISMKGAV